jgi:hypothetical protein
MSTSSIAHRPTADEHAPFYAGYVARVPEGDVRAALHAQREELAALLASVPRARWDHRYADGKWTVREVAGHVLDGEWVFAARLVHFARGNAGPLPGMDQDPFLAAGGYGARPLDAIAAAFDHLRAATLAEVDALAPEQLDLRGVASGHPITVRALCYVLAGHAAHHADVLRERYLG